MLSHTEELMSENDLTKQLMETEEDENDKNNPRDGLFTMGMWSILMIINLIVLMSVLHSFVFFDVPLENLEEEVLRNSTRAQVSTIVKDLDPTEVTNFKWESVTSSTIKDYMHIKHNKTLKLEDIQNVLKNKYRTFDQFVKAVEDGKDNEIVVNNVKLQMTDLKKDQSYDKFRDGLLENSVGIIKTGYFNSIRYSGQPKTQHFTSQNTEDGLFHPGPFKQIKPPYKSEKDEIIEYFDPVFYESIGYDNYFITRLDVPALKLSTSGVKEMEQSLSTDCFDVGAIYIRSPYGSSSWQSLNSLTMERPTPSLSPRSVRTWIPCENESLLECTLLRCNDKMNSTEILNTYNIDCDKGTFGLLGKRVDDTVMITSDNPLEWGFWYKQENGVVEKRYITDIVAEKLFTPIDSTYLRLQSNELLGYGAISYRVIAEMEQEVSFNTHTGYFTFKINIIE